MNPDVKKTVSRLRIDSSDCDEFEQTNQYNIQQPAIYVRR